MVAVTICSDFGAPKIKSATVSTVSPSICHQVMGPDATISVFCMLSFKPTFSLSSFTFIKRLFSSLLSAIRVVSSAYHRLSRTSQKGTSRNLEDFQSPLRSHLHEEGKLEKFHFIYTILEGSV